MQNFTIVTDSNADLLPQFISANGVVEMQLTYIMEDRSYACHDPAMTRHEFYEKMRGGKMPQTAAVNMSDAITLLEPALEQGKDVLCIMFSSALSATYNSVCLAKEEIADRFPDRKIIVIDTLSASGGQGMLVELAVAYRAQGLSIDETADRIRGDAPHIAHLITVDDLFHLQRGGRVSATAAVVGSVLGIKPMLHVNDAGKLLPTGKVRGRKQSLLALASAMEEMVDRDKCDWFSITHGDCEEDAKFLIAEIAKRTGIQKHTINYIGPTVGAHSGPGTVALFFYANKR